MSEWKVLTAEEFCDSVRDGTHDTPRQVECGYKLVTAKHISNGQIDLSDAYLISESDYLKINERSKVERWDVLMSMIGNGLGKSAVVKDNPQYAIKNLALFKIGDETRAKWLHYYLSSNKGQGFIYNSLQGSGQPFISLSLLRKFPIPVPDDEKIMRKVVANLSRYDSLIENYQKQIKLLEEAAQRLYKEWLVDLHFPGYENTLIIDGVPEGWEKKLVGDVTPIKTGKKDANFGTDNGPFPFFTCAQEPIKAPSYSFDTSAVILAGNGDFNVKLYRGKFEAYQRTYVLEPTNENMLYLLYFCISENMNRLATGASGSTIKFLTKGMIESLVIIEPSICVLDSFNQIIEPIRTQKENLQSQIRLLTEARDRLLPKIMSGEIEFNFK